MTGADWAVGALLTFVLVLTVMLCRLAFGFSDRKRDRAELRRSAKRAAGEL